MLLILTSFSFNPSTECIMHATIISLLGVPLCFLYAHIHFFRVSFSVYPSVVASLTKSLEAIIREPCGCFEQLSAATYPMVRLDVMPSFTEKLSVHFILWPYGHCLAVL